MGGVGIYVIPGCGAPVGPTGWETIPGPIRRMSFLEPGRDPMDGCGVWPR